MNKKDSTKDLLEAVVAQLKAEAIIDSCSTCEHIDNAKLYIDLFYEKFRLIDEYENLYNLLEKKKRNLKCPE